MPARLRPYLVIAALTLGLGTAWTIADWSNLSALVLPDTDDAMRLQQVRDWLAGQPLSDVSQHRLAGGLAMHWSRIPDLLLAASIFALRPLTGTAWAEVSAVIGVPLLHFAALLLLVRSTVLAIAPRAAATAVVLAALSYPASALFMPGRIDHHALQLLLVLLQVRALLAPSERGSGIVAGLAVATGAAVGLETLPFAVLTATIVVIGWLRGDGGGRQTGFGLAIGIGLLALLPLAGRGGDCDTIGPLAAPTIAGGLALAALARIDHHRAGFLAVTAAALAILAWPAAQPCLAGPYATVDPLVARLWLAQVGEAQPLFAATPAAAIAYAGLLVAGLVAGGWLAWRRGGSWWLLLAYQALAAGITLAQLRGAHVGAALAVVPLATLLSEQRLRGRTSAVLALWIGGAGLSYPLLAGTLAPRAAVAANGPDCSTPALLATLNALPAGRVMAGIDLGAYLIAGTHHSAIAAPYHRNNAGNAAMYRFFLGAPDRARAIARHWGVDYVVVCSGSMGDVRTPPGTIAGGVRPAWLRPLRAAGRASVVFSIDHDLSDARRSR